MTTPELTKWLRENSSGVYRPAADAADLIDDLVKRFTKLEHERDILKKHISIMDISHKTANDEYFELAADNEKLERERDEWKAKYIQQNKDLGCEQMDPNGTIWEYAKKLQKDIAAINDRRDNFEERLRVELGGHPDSELWGDAGLIAATMRCVDALDEVTEQRDRLAAVLQRIRDGYGGQAAAPDCCEDCEFLIPIDEALQSLNQPTKP